MSKMIKIKGLLTLYPYQSREFFPSGCGRNPDWFNTFIEIHGEGIFNTEFPAPPEPINPNSRHDYASIPNSDYFPILNDRDLYMVDAIEWEGFILIRFDTPPATLEEAYRRMSIAYSALDLGYEFGFEAGKKEAKCELRTWLNN